MIRTARYLRGGLALLLFALAGFSHAVSAHGKNETDVPPVIFVHGLQD